MIERLWLHSSGIATLALSEHYNTLTSHRSPSSVADAIEHIAERIMVKAAEQATRVVDRDFLILGVQVCAHRARHMQSSKCCSRQKFSSSVRCALAAS